MFRLDKLTLASLSIIVVTVLTACSLGQTPEPTATPVDLTAIYNASLSTAQAQMSLSAPTLAPTATITLPPTETPLAETPTITATSGSGGNVEITLTITPSGTPPLNVPGQTATETPFGATAIPSFTPVSGSSGSGSSGSGQLCKNAAFDGDLSVPDGTVFKPLEEFRKVWKVRNTGICKWDDGFYFASVSDNAPTMGSGLQPYYFRFEKDFVGPGEAVDIGIDMIAPGAPGEYVAHWHMFDDQGQPFGGDFTVVIKVVK